MRLRTLFSSSDGACRALFDGGACCDFGGKGRGRSDSMLFMMPVSGAARYFGRRRLDVLMLWEGVRVVLLALVFGVAC